MGQATAPKASLRFIERAATESSSSAMDILILFHFGRASRCSPANLILTFEHRRRFQRNLLRIYGLARKKRDPTVKNEIVIT